MNNTEMINQLNNAKEYFAAGYFSEINNKLIFAFANGLKNLFEKVELPNYNGEMLYPLNSRAFYGTNECFLSHNYSYPFTYNEKKLKELDINNEIKQYILEYCRNKYKGGEVIDMHFAIAGRGYTHFVPNFEYFLNNGLISSINFIKEKNDDFSKAVLIVLEAIKQLSVRIYNELIKYRNNEYNENLERLIEAYKYIPLNPTKKFFEAILMINFIWHIDGCDSLGRLDVHLTKYYNGEKYAYNLIREFFVSVENICGWNLALGANNAITSLCIKAVNGLSKPNLAFLISENTPEYLLKEAIEQVSKGGGLPAFYNEIEYINGLQSIGVSLSDSKKFAFGGCSETLIEGLSNVGSIDGGINLPAILTRLLSKIKTSIKFNELLILFKNEIIKDIDVLTMQINKDMEKKTESTPQLIRSILCGDCLVKGKEFNEGGARYNFSIINISGLANVVDSFLAIKKLVYEQHKYTLIELINNTQLEFKLNNNYLIDLKTVAKFGNDDFESNSLAAEITETAFKHINTKHTWRGNGKFIPACIMFSSFCEVGESTQATPDGRINGEELADSGGAAKGRDVLGPTALLNSVAAISPKKALGTWIVNMRLSKAILSSEKGKESLHALIKTYFQKGGMQLQINTVDTDILKKAIETPEKYKDIIVRVGGFSEHFVKLDKKMQESIISRTEHR
jgi:formate C-acetyltransferase